MMTHDEMIAVIQAHKEGKEIEFQAIHGLVPWETLGASPRWTFAECNYRIKPTRKLRAWRPEEVPVGAIVDFDSGENAVILCAHKADMGHSVPHIHFYAHNHAVQGYTLTGLCDLKHSTDNGKTWLPCGVMEE